MMHKSFHAIFPRDLYLGPVYWHLYSLETLLPALFVIVLYCLYVWIIWYKLAFTAHLMQLLESGLKM
jgi:hypothetical protein